MKTLYLLTVFMFFSAHTILGGFFDGNWSILSSPDIDIYKFRQISGKDEYIWLKADNSVIRFNVKTNELKQFNYDFSSLDFEEAVFFPLDSGHIALTSSRGICTFDGSNWTFINTPYESAGSVIDNSGTMWSISNYTGTDNTHGMVYYYKDSQWLEAPFNDHITGFLNLINIDSDNKIWLTEATKVYCYNPANDSLSIFPSDQMKYTIHDQSGNVWFYNDSSLYSTSNSGLIHKYKNIYTFRPDLLQIDSRGDLWFVSKDFNKQIFKVSPDSFQSIWRFNTPDLASGLHSNKYGVFTFSNSGLFYFKDNDTIASNIFFDSILCSSCPNIRLTDPEFSLFRKNGSHLYIVNDLFSKELLVQRVGDKCSIIPLPSEECHITSMYEKSDGTLIAGICGENCGLYSLNGLTWTLYSGTEGMRINKLFEDSKGKIWGHFEGKIIRQTQSGWELIDTSNSDLPRPIKNAGFGFAFVEDSEHAIWTVFDSSVARTFDGYNWTTYTHHGFNSYSYSNQNLLYTDQNNNVQLLWCDSLESTSFVNRATFFDNEWHYEKILCPVNTPRQSFVNQDSRGVIYLTPFKGDTLFYYDSTDSNWLKLDNSITPYDLWSFISDDNQGKIYFQDRLNQTVVFEYNTIKVNKRNITKCKQNGLNVHFMPSGKLAINFRLNKAGNMNIGVFSPNGKLIKTLFNGFHPGGTFMNSYDLNCSGGMYIIQLKTSDKSLVSSIVIR